MNNGERSLWVNHNGALYYWWKSTRLTLAAFIKEHKVSIDQHIAKVLGRKTK